MLWQLVRSSPTSAVLAVVALLAANTAAAAQAAPSRIVSLDYCADQYVLQLAERHHIVGLSPDATREFSYLREKAVGLPTVRPIAEDVVITRPDMIVRSYGGGASALGFFSQLGIPVVQIGYAGSLADIRQTVLDVSAALHSAERGVALVQDMDNRLRDIAAQQTDAGAGSSVDALYMTPSGVTSGTGTLVHDMFNAAALKNFENRPGWHALPLEKLAYGSPRLIALAFFESLTNHANVWSAIHHPVAKAQQFRPEAVPLNGAWTACGGWFLLDAVEALHEAVMSARRVTTASADDAKNE